ncbi:MAG: hypothetical protein IRY91_05095, partial [Gemmatimonadaceae bacterium]|nr:hypothetical protein [Gemmatimonadaceae bacterium]
MPTTTPASGAEVVVSVTWTTTTPKALSGADAVIESSRTSITLPVLVTTTRTPVPRSTRASASPAGRLSAWIVTGRSTGTTRGVKARPSCACRLISRSTSRRGTFRTSRETRRASGPVSARWARDPAGVSTAVLLAGAAALGLERTVEGSACATSGPPSQGASHTAQRNTTEQRTRMTSVWSSEGKRGRGSPTPVA